MHLNDLPDILTAKAIANFLQISLRKAYDLMDIQPNAGGLPCKRIGKCKRVLKSDLIKWLEAN